MPQSYYIYVDLNLLKDGKILISLHDYSSLPALYTNVVQKYDETNNNKGGTGGIGLETARVLAMRGAHVIIAARNTKAGNEAKEMIRQMNPNARVDFLQLDVSSIKSVRSFAHQFLALNVPLNILMYE